MNMLGRDIIPYPIQILFFFDSPINRGVNLWWRYNYMKVKCNCCDGIYNSFDVHFTSACDNRCAHCVDAIYEGLHINMPDVDAIVKTIVDNEDGLDDVLRRRTMSLFRGFDCLCRATSSQDIFKTLCNYFRSEVLPRQ